ncbi:MAG TPA: V-type ATP synthase subunit I [Deltaproteobacteria bacterium]|nr:V-type ATP synthase subunit I [Deltaproteobacteria bacterium]HPR56273.1 V-type ATP synthase subunit I [Deltaproteobacteria bacterium]HXK46493.1 V-type ATP synthase subunit I [Deltaproteobacteria bacterium]
MAIEELKKVSIVSPRHADRRVLRAVNRLGMMEVIDLGEDLEDRGALEPCEATTEEADENLRKVEFILNLIHIFAPEETGFVKGLTPVPLVTTNAELNEVLDGYDLEETYRMASELDEVYRSSERIVGEIENEIAELEPFVDVPFDLAEFFGARRTRLFYGTIPRARLNLLAGDRAPWDRVAWEFCGSDGGSVRQAAAGERERVVFAAVRGDEEQVRRALDEVGFEEVALPRLKESVSERLSELRDNLGMYRQKVEEVAGQVRQLAGRRRFGEGRRPLTILKAYWLNTKERIAAYNRGMRGRWLHMISGYVRTRDIPRLISVMEQEFPESVITIDDPGRDEDVPVSISVPYVFRPMQLLVEMFGLPPYRSFDPTPFLQLNFYVFFGICFSDVCYGLMLVAFSAYLTSRTKDYRGVNNFARILLYGGISSIVFGALMGSWFGDLYKPEYLGANNPLLRLQQGLMVIDPMGKTILALIVALGLGVLNQFFGISLRMYGQIRQKDWIGAFSDGICWIVTLIGLLIVISKIFVTLPGRIYTTGVWLFWIGAAGLILTQGRGIRNPFGRIAAGVVSLYGIVGSYGITSFIGDTLSYCRLLALGLTTSIVAMAFNLMAGMLRDVPYVGIVLFVLILLIGHVFNFAISVLGAFVHSMRLIYVEFFGRFYETGARAFQPLGFDSPLCILKKTESEV